MTASGRAIEFRGAPNFTRNDAPRPGVGRGYLALPPGGSGPGVLVLHAWWGLNDTFRGVADRLAQEGFVALAPDLFGDGVVATTIAEATVRVDELDEIRAEQAALGAVDRLVAEPGLVGDRIGVLGFSLGANYSLWVAQKRPDQVAANVLVYGSGAPGAGRSLVQGHFAVGDEWEPDDDVELMAAGLRGAGRGGEIHWYPGTRHWFFEPDRPEYDPAAAELAWSRFVPFLRGALAGSGNGEGR